MLELRLNSPHHRPLVGAGSLSLVRAGSLNLHAINGTISNPFTEAINIVDHNPNNKKSQNR